MKPAPAFGELRLIDTTEPRCKSEAKWWAPGSYRVPGARVIAELSGSDTSRSPQPQFEADVLPLHHPAG